MVEKLCNRRYQSASGRERRRAPSDFSSRRCAQCTAVALRNARMRRARCSFRDGNKRVAFVVMVVFLELNAWSFEAQESEVVRANGGIGRG
jgi:hypothetical protein